MPSWSISVLGNNSVFRTGKGQFDISASGWLILGYLICQPNHRSVRARLVAALWPDSGEDEGRHCLSTALWRLKRPFSNSKPVLNVDAEIVALEHRSWIDADAFEIRVVRGLETRSCLSAAARIKALRRGLQLYRGDFLNGILADWAILERERLAALRLDALFALASLEAREGRWDAAIGPARLLCAIEPLREDGQRLLMEAYAATGNRALALRQYRLCADVLGKELAVEPMPETQALARRLAGPRNETPASVPSRQSAVTELIATRATLVDAIGSLDAVIGLRPSGDGPVMPR